MRPKEKAKELLKEFSYWVDCTSDWGEYDIGKELENSKECAKISVSEIMNTFTEIDTRRDYWNEVLKEINEL